LYRGGLQKVVLNQRFYPKIHLHQVLTVSVFHFHFPFPVSISTVSNCPLETVENGKQKQKMENGNGQILMHMYTRVKPLIFKDHLCKDCIVI